MPIETKADDDNQENYAETFRRYWAVTVIFLVGISLSIIGFTISLTRASAKLEREFSRQAVSHFTHIQERFMHAKRDMYNYRDWLAENDPQGNQSANVANIIADNSSFIELLWFSIDGDAYQGTFLTSPSRTNLPLNTPQLSEVLQETVTMSVQTKSPILSRPLTLSHTPPSPNAPHAPLKLRDTLKLHALALPPLPGLSHNGHRGVLVGLLDMTDCFSMFLDDEKTDIYADIFVFDTNHTGESELIYHTGEDFSAFRPEKNLTSSAADILPYVPYHFMKDLNFGGKDMTILLVPRINYISAVNIKEPWLFLLLGFGLTTGIAIFFYQLIGKNIKIEQARRDITVKEERFRQAIDYSPIGMALVGADGAWLRVNKAMCDIVGYSEDELLKTNFQSITHKDDLDSDLSYVKQLIDKKINTYQMEKRYIHKDGHEVWVQLNVSLALDADKNPLYFISQIQDITARKKADDILHTYMRQLERSNQELDDFAHIASHDMKEPLRGIHHNVSILAEDYADILDAEGQKRLDRLAALAKRMNDLIGDLLSYSKVGRSELACQNTDLNDVVQDVKHTIELAHHGDEDIQISIVKKLPVVDCDEVRITEVYRNLITNAIKYNTSDVKQIDIGWEEMDYKGRIHEVFYVKDNGIGIEQNFYDSVFRIFKRLHHQHKYGEGTGAGLTFVKKIIQRHSGEIWLESEPDKGTTFYFTLPGDTKPEEQVSSSVKSQQAARNTKES